MYKTVLRIGRVFGVITSSGDMNYHGKGGEPLCMTVRLVRMGSYAKMWTLYIYGPSGAWFGVMVEFPRWRGPWPKNCSESEPIKR